MTYVAEHARLSILEFGTFRDGTVDLAAWRFTPNSFEAMLGDLRQMGHIKLRTNRIYPTRTFASEFWVVLQK